jgi:hypothetical protein
MVSASEITGFSSFGSYFSGLARTPIRILQRVALLRTAEDAEESKAEGKHQMKAVLGVWDLVAMGVGMILGAGVFVTTGSVAVNQTGCAQSCCGASVSRVNVGCCEPLAATGTRTES